MAKLKVAVIFGGVSSEHEISLLSAYSVLTNIPADKYDVFCVGITKKGRWMYYPGEYENIKNGEWEKDPDCSTAILSPDALHKGFIVMGKDDNYVRKVDVVFPVLHGANGEDGSVQGLCQLAGLPCVGCDMPSSAVCMDKSLTHTVLDAAGIKTAKYVVFGSGCLHDTDGACAEVEEKLGYPVYIKPACAGSSVGVSRAADRNALKNGLKVAFAHGNKVLVEREIVGKEVECAVLGNKAERLLASVPGQITPAEEFYDYDAKYKLGTSVLDIPAKISDEQMNRLRDIAARAYIACGCSGLSRVDFFVTSDDIILNEINTIPGFTDISMYPKLMGNMGIPYPALLDKLIQLAIERNIER